MKQERGSDTQLNQEPSRQPGKWVVRTDKKAIERNGGKKMGGSDIQHENRESQDSLREKENPFPLQLRRTVQRQRDNQDKKRE